MNTDYPSVTDGNSPMMVLVPAVAKANLKLKVDLLKFMERIIAAEDARTLACYSPPKATESQGCVYDDGKGHKCIIGAGLPDGFIKHGTEYNGETSFRTLVDSNIIDVPELFHAKLHELQRFHDAATLAAPSERLAKLTRMRTALYKLNSEISAWDFQMRHLARIADVQVEIKPLY